MTKLLVRSYGCDTLYSLASISNISSAYAMNFYDEEELSYSGIKPIEPLTVIDFYDGTRATYIAKDTEMSFQ